MSILDQQPIADGQAIATIESHFSYLDRRPLSQTITSVQCKPSELFTYRVLKRIFDLIFVFVSLPVVLPAFMVIVTVLIIDSRGPVFFSHNRIHRGGNHFRMWKFRTMCVNSNAVLEKHLAKNPSACEEWQRNHKLRYDPRITRFGAFLRRTSLDELPQIWNILNGTMTLVGPRPIVTAEIPKYGNCFGCYCEVKPGLTGLWQVSGRSKLTYAKRVALDCEYVWKWSLWRDFLICLRTFNAVFKQDGAF